jgi:hypothetical protein
MMASGRIEVCPREKHIPKNAMVSHCLVCNEDCRSITPCKGCWIAKALEQVRGWRDELEYILQEYVIQGEIAVNAAADLGELASRMVLRR